MGYCLGQARVGLADVAEQPVGQIALEAQDQIAGRTVAFKPLLEA